MWPTPTLRGGHGAPRAQGSCATGAAGAAPREAVGPAGSIFLLNAVKHVLHHARPRHGGAIRGSRARHQSLLHVAVELGHFLLHPTWLYFGYSPCCGARGGLLPQMVAQWSQGGFEVAVGVKEVIVVTGSSRGEARCWCWWSHLYWGRGAGAGAGQFSWLLQLVVGWGGCLNRRVDGTISCPGQFSLLVQRPQFRQPRTSFRSGIC